MMIKTLPGNPCHSVMVCLSENELLSAGLTAGEISLQNRNMKLLMRSIFRLLREAVGLCREGNYVAVACRPLKNGGCRFFIQFTCQPSGRVFVFENADDLLDAISQLNRHTQRCFTKMEITRSGDRYMTYIPAEWSLSEQERYLLDEYSE